MSTVFVLLAEGFEESEAIVPVDIMKRAGLDVKLVSVDNEKCVKGSHGIVICADMAIKDICVDDILCIMLPGGGLGTTNLKASQKVGELCLFAFKNNKTIAAICAAPSVLGGLGILKGKKAVCYPSFEKYLDGANVTDNRVEHDGNVITAKGMGVSVEFGLALVSALVGTNKADEIAEGIIK